MSETDCIIRTFEEKDRLIVQKLAAEVQNYERTLDSRRADGDLIKVRQVEKLLKPIKEDNGILIVAELNGEVVGYIAGYKQVDDMDTYERFYIADLSVTEKCRGQGIGTKLLKEAERVAIEKFHLENIRIGVLAPNVEAKKLYEKLGFTEHEIELQKRL